MSTQTAERGRPAPLLGAIAPDLKADVARQDAGVPFQVVSEFAPAGDQPKAIEELIGGIRANRSEEHTSELQSLMRISYAVFCLNKKKKQTNISYIISTTLTYHNTTNTTTNT